MKPNQYLDLAIKKAGVKNDNQLMQAIGWGKSKVNNYRHNRQLMDNEAARQIAELINVPVMQVIADMEAERAKEKETRNAWKMLSKMSKEAGKATSNLLILNVIFSLSALYYILCKIARHKTGYQGVSAHILGKIPNKIGFVTV